MSEDQTRRILESEVERLQKENERLQELVARPVNVYSAPDPNMQQIVSYLPQLTFIATNLSMVASAIQASNTNLDRIARVLEDRSKGIGMPL